MKIVRRILTEGLRLWPTGDGAWCHAAVAVTADTPHSEHWAMSCNSWWYLMVSDGTNGVGVSPAQCPAWLRFVLSLVPWEGRAPACSEPQLSLTWVRPSLLHDISAHLVPQPPAGKWVNTCEIWGEQSGICWVSRITTSWLWLVFPLLRKY